jgi:predicted TIM-barrel enzyme
VTLKDLLAGDFVVAHNAAKRGSLVVGLLPLGDANAATLDLLRARPEVPVVAGLCATDPFRDRDRLLAEVKELGAVAVINLPSVGLIDGQFGRSLSAAELGYEKEVDFLRAARRAGFLALGMSFNADQAAMMRPAVDAIVAPKGVELPDALIWDNNTIRRAT